MSQSRSDELFVQSRNAMGTVFTIYLYAQNGEEAEAAQEAAFEEIERVEEALSNYRASSELSRINRVAAQQPVTTDPEVFALLGDGTRSQAPKPWPAIARLCSRPRTCSVVHNMGYNANLFRNLRMPPC